METELGSEQLFAALDQQAAPSSTGQDLTGIQAPGCRQRRSAGRGRRQSPGRPASVSPPRRPSARPVILDADNVMVCGWLDRGLRHPRQWTT
ncbi:MAG: hypothetical protein R3F43_15485 [bacterium]